MSEESSTTPIQPLGDTPRSQSPRLHVVCSIRSSRDRELLVGWLESIDRVTVSTASPEELAVVPFDLCIVDQPTLSQSGDRLLARSQRAQPVALPCLLVTARSESHTSAGRAVVPDDLQPLVTDIIKPPVRKAQLRRRLDVLLEIRQQSKQLASSNAHHRELLELLPEAVFVIADGEIQYVNSAGECLLDASEPILLGTAFLDYVASEDQSTAADLLDPETAAAAVSEHRTAFVELELHVDGEAVITEAAATPVGLDEDAVQLVCRDMTERNERESRLRLYRTAMDEATVGITITDARELDNPLVYVNREFEKLTGHDGEELLGENPRLVQSPRTDPETVAEIRKSVDAGEPISVELINQRADGTEWYNALTISPVHQDGELTHFLGFQRNVSASRAQQNQLAVLDRVLRHNLRNRLNVVLGHAETLADGTSTEAVPIHASAICKTATELLALSEKTRRFRTALEADAETTTTVGLGGVIEDSLGPVREEWPDARFEYRVDETARVQSENAVRFAVTELLTNAVDHTESETPQVRIEVTTADGEVEIRISDTGPGIPEDERQPFDDTTETPVDHAIGIGLWLVRWAVNSAGGDLDYEERDPHGSRITIRLPAVADSPNDRT
ncbi:MAG: PAS domain S-box protein [Euryarchaeota archaeon]|nr:PAS domain S-box protein [Euryarchaeota archaeon]